MATDEIIRALLNREEVIGNLIGTASSSVRSTLHDTLCNHVGSVINSISKHSAGRPQIDVRRNLASDELQMLIKDYPEFSITSSACESGTHNMAACYRFLETEYLLKFMPKRDAMIWDIGGNWFSHMKYRSDMNIHCCCPILSLRDSERLESRCMSMQNFMRSDKDKSLALYSKYNGILREQETRRRAFEENSVTPEKLNGVVFCENTFQECVQEAPEGHVAAAVAIHSLYDVDIHSLVKALKRKRISQLFGCMLFPPGILVGQTQGDLPAVKGKFEVKKGKIHFFFLNDPNAGYSHSLKDYATYFEKTYIDIPEGLFKIDLLQMRGDTMLFKITDVTAGAYHMRYRGIKFDEEFKCVPLGAQSSVVVPVFSWDERGIRFATALFPRNIVENGASYAMKNKEKDLTVAVLKNYLSSVNNSYIFNGSQVRQGEKVNPSLLSQLAVTIYLREKVARYREERVVAHFEQLFIDDIGLSDLFVGITWKRNKQKIADFYRRLKLDLAKWFGMKINADQFDICDPPLYIELQDRWELNVKGDISIGELFDCEDEAREHDLRIEEKRQTAEDLVAKVTGLSVNGSTPRSECSDNLKKFSQLLAFALPMIVAGKSRSDSSADAASVLSNAFNSASSSSLRSMSDEFVPMWEVAHKDELIFKKIDGDLAVRTALSIRPQVVKSYYQNARAEFLYYQLAGIISERSQMLDIVLSFRAGFLHTDRVVSPLSAYIYSCEKNDWVLRTPKPSEVGHNFAVHFDFLDVEGDSEDCLAFCKIVDVRWDKSNGYVNNKPMIPKNTGYYLFCEPTRLCNNYLIYNNLVDEFYRQQDRPVTFELVEGVPGCGKSSEILSKANSRHEAVVGEGRKAMDDLRNRFITEKKWSRDIARRRVRTLDSVLLSTIDVPKCTTIHFDEALKVHFGAILFCADKMKSKLVIGQGDRAQLPMICRVEGIELKFDKPDYNVVKVTPKLMSYRIPGDVAYYLTSKGFYKDRGVPQSVTTKNKVQQSMTARGENTKEKFISLQDLPISPDIQYLTFLQAEKETLISHLKSKGIKDFSVNTVHEAQGGTFPHVVLVRLQRTENEIYPGGFRCNSYIVVAVSRHTKTFMYCSVYDDKLLLDIVGDNGLKNIPVRSFSEHIIK